MPASLSARPNNNNNNDNNNNNMDFISCRHRQQLHTINATQQTATQDSTE